MKEKALAVAWKYQNATLLIGFVLLIMLANFLVSVDLDSIAKIPGFAGIIGIGWFIYWRTFFYAIEMLEEKQGRNVGTGEKIFTFVTYVIPPITVWIFIATWLYRLFGIDPKATGKAMWGAGKLVGKATGGAVMATAGAMDAAGNAMQKGVNDTISNTKINSSSSSKSEDSVSNATTHSSSANEQSVEIVGSGEIKRDGSKIFTEYSVSSNGTGSIPNSTYTIENNNSVYKAIRGSSANPYYLFDNAKSSTEAMQYIVEDVKSKGATNITIQ